MYEIHVHQGVSRLEATTFPYVKVILFITTNCQLISRPLPEMRAVALNKKYELPFFVTRILSID